MEGRDYRGVVVVVYVRLNRFIRSKGISLVFDRYLVFRIVCGIKGNWEGIGNGL